MDRKNWTLLGGPKLDEIFVVFSDRHILDEFFVCSHLGPIVDRFFLDSLLRSFNE